jgi:hypothetical protein
MAVQSARPGHGLDVIMEPGSRERLGIRYAGSVVPGNFPTSIVSDPITKTLSNRIAALLWRVLTLLRERHPAAGFRERLADVRACIHASGVPRLAMSTIQRQAKQYCQSTRVETA